MFPGICSSPKNLTPVVKSTNPFAHTSLLASIRCFVSHIKCLNEINRKFMEVLMFFLLVKYKFYFF